MMARNTVQLGFWLLAGAGAALAGQPPASADVEGVTAVSSKVSDDYVRARRPDGTFEPENYAFGKGGRWAGEISDSTIDTLHFMDVARVIAPALTSQRYLPARDPAGTKLLIMVYWGTTAVPGSTSNSTAVEQFRVAQGALSGATRVNNRAVGPTGSNEQLAAMSAATVMLNMENTINDRIDFKNALMLGYDSPGLIGTEKGNYVRGTAFGVDRGDLYADIEENRYFVVLMAYDFQVLWKEKKHKLLWETRFSISERRNAFDKALPVMAQYASRYFGQASNGLLRERVPEGRVDVGEVKSLGEVEAPRK
jgi:hypothetical protein